MDEDYDLGSIMFLSHTENLDSTYLKTMEMKRYKFEKKDIRIISISQEENKTKLRITCEGFAHGVHIKENLKCSDNYFDVLPGEIKEVCVENPEKKEILFGQIR